MSAVSQVAQIPMPTALPIACCQLRCVVRRSGQGRRGDSALDDRVPRRLVGVDAYSLAAADGRFREEALDRITRIAATMDMVVSIQMRPSRPNDVVTSKDGDGCARQPAQRHDVGSRIIGYSSRWPRPSIAGDNGGATIETVVVTDVPSLPAAS